MSKDCKQREFVSSYNFSAPTPNDMESYHNMAITKLNYCATLSKLGKHEKAVKHAQAAISLIQQVYGQSIEKQTNQ